MKSYVDTCIVTIIDIYHILNVWICIQFHSISWDDSELVYLIHSLRDGELMNMLAFRLILLSWNKMDNMWIGLSPDESCQSALVRSQLWFR